MFFSGLACSTGQIKNTKNCQTTIMDKNNKAKLVKIAFCPSNNTSTIWEKHRFKIENILDSPYIFKNTSERGRITYYKNGAISLIYNEESWVDNIGILPKNLPLSKKAMKMLRLKKKFQ